jgi:hypothetical protein
MAKNIDDLITANLDRVLTWLIRAQMAKKMSSSGDAAKLVDQALQKCFHYQQAVIELTQSADKVVWPVSTADVSLWLEKTGYKRREHPPNWERY